MPAKSGKINQSGGNIVSGTEKFDRIVTIGQAAITKMKYSNVVTYSEVYSGIRKIFGGRKEAREKGLIDKHFSFNTKGGRCENCEGLGYVASNMLFFINLEVTCPICGGNQFNDEVLQSAFVNLINCLDKIEEINSNKTRAYLVIIVRNISIDLYRKRNKQYDIVLDDIEDILPDGSMPLDEKIINAEMFSRISSKIQELHKAYSDIISLKYFYSHSDSEIAKLLNITQENVRIRLYRARQSLIKILSQDRELSNNE